MFNPSMKKNSFSAALLAGVAGAVITSSAAFAAPSQQGTALEPQALPAHVHQEYTYTRTERVVPHVDSSAMYNHDADTATMVDRDYSAPDQAHRSKNVNNPNNIAYLSGGVGADEQARLEAAQSQYPVKMVFSNTNGAYVSNVDVTVMNASGETVLGMQTDGPILLLDLEPGKYTVKANDHGQEKTQHIKVSDASKSYTVRFQATGPQDYSMNDE
ncbi:MAG: T9SS type A sorting domain-containing protein [Alphaproteobacteria bacterium]|nr:T9SS type A sorting domain-containing protein [Alphaproteobacteria bacterium]